MTTEIVPADIRVGALRVESPEAVLDRATIVAKALADMIRKCGLAMQLGKQGKEYVRVDGWAAMGAMLGVLAREEQVVRLEDGSYEARVELVRAADGVVVGGASAVCGMDEERWAKAPEYARRSMAITRAAGKAFRLAFSWVMVLAGYEPTPLEEIEDAPQKPEPKQEKQDAVTTFWSYIKERGIDRAAAEQALRDAKGDFRAALGALRKLHE